MTKEWLRQKTTVDELEQRHLASNERLEPDPVPFGFQNQEWLRFKDQIREGDELWEFASPPETWECLCGRAGICIIRNGEMIDFIVTLMN